MYHMDQLLSLLTAERAKELRFRAGRPPLMVLDDEQHCLQGPPITHGDLARLLRSLATSRQMRDLRECGAVQFVYTAVRRAPFVVLAQMEDEDVFFTVEDNTGARTMFRSGGEQQTPHPVPLPFRRGEGEFFFCCFLPRVAFVPHLPWAEIILPRWGGRVRRDGSDGTHGTNGTTWDGDGE